MLPQKPRSCTIGWNTGVAKLSKPSSLAKDKSTAAASGLSAGGKVGWTFGGSPTSAAETHLPLQHEPAVMSRGRIRDEYDGK